MNLRLRYFGSLLAVGCLLVMPAGAGFLAPYDPPNWTLTGPGSVDTSAPNSITLFGFEPSASTTDYTIGAAGSGNWSFSWSFQTSDAGFQDAGWLLNGAYTLLANDNASGGVGPVAVNTGDLIGFRVNVAGSSFDDGALTITDFTAPGASAVPEPSTLPLMALIGLSAATVARLRLRRKNRQV